MTWQLAVGLLTCWRRTLALDKRLPMHACTSTVARGDVAAADLGCTRGALAPHYVRLRLARIIAPQRHPGIHRHPTPYMQGSTPQKAHGSPKQ